MLKPIPRAEELKWKDRFVDRYSALTDFEEFKKYSLSFLRKSIRVNTLKMDVLTLKKRLEGNWQLTQVPWCKEGFWIEGVRRDIGNLPEHVLGYIYVQEAASMIPPLVLDPQPSDRVLDMCAAPGSKSTQIAQYMNNEGILVANDAMGKRIAALGVNMQRCGVRNAILTNMQGHKFHGQEFDRVLVDAPCSGTGTIRKSLKTVNMWNPNMVKRLSGTQKQLIKKGYELLKSGGTLVYSTCTLEPDEDESVVSWLLDKTDAKLEDIYLEIKRGKAVVEFEGKTFNSEVKRCLRLWPQDNDTEGFFIAKIRKP